MWSRGALRTDDGPPASWSEITPNLGWLLGGSVMAAALVNAAPIGVDILANSSQAELVTRFGNGVILARVPLFLFQAIQAEPSTDLTTIARRQDAVAEFHRHPGASSRVGEALAGVRDIPRILARLQNRLRNPRELGGVQIGRAHV